MKYDMAMYEYSTVRTTYSMYDVLSVHTYSYAVLYHVKL